MKFRIGTKISLLTCTMVLVASLFLSQRLMEYCVNHVVDHEVVDLEDETNLSAQKILRGADEMRQDISYLAARIADDEREILGEAHERRLAPDEPLPRLHDLLNELLLKHPDFLQVEVLALGPGRSLPGQDLNESAVVARMRRRSVESFDVPAGRSEFLAELLGSSPRIAQLSKFGQTQVVYRSAEELARLSDPGVEPEDVPESGRKLILLGGAIILPATDGKG